MEEIQQGEEHVYAPEEVENIIVQSIEATL